MRHAVGLWDCGLKVQTPDAAGFLSHAADFSPYTGGFLFSAIIFLVEQRIQKRNTTVEGKSARIIGGLSFSATYSGGGGLEPSPTVDVATHPIAQLQAGVLRPVKSHRQSKHARFPIE